jgi:hypothetical protein
MAPIFERALWDSLPALLAGSIDAPQHIPAGSMLSVGPNWRPTAFPRYANRDRAWMRDYVVTYGMDGKHVAMRPGWRASACPGPAQWRAACLEACRECRPFAELRTRALHQRWDTKGVSR